MCLTKENTLSFEAQPKYLVHPKTFNFLIPPSMSALSNTKPSKLSDREPVACRCPSHSAAIDALAPEFHASPMLANGQQNSQRKKWHKM
ncbi:hypothetical protein BN961_02021 [Afipia felis]|uniref:Uncharacterized protein n=1 Tax=Afipia felis TaxID=1035 RepID=A0A090MMF1_AFIFE|nr:hypothetical protein BN961_02021 [Afipia felis]